MSSNNEQTSPSKKMRYDESLRPLTPEEIQWIVSDMEDNNVKYLMIKDLEETLIHHDSIQDLKRELDEIYSSIFNR